MFLDNTERASEFNHENADSQAHPVDERFLKKVGNPQSRDCVTLRFLQLLLDAQEHSMHSGNGGGTDGSYLESGLVAHA